MRPRTRRRIATRTLGNPSGFPSGLGGAWLGPRPPRPRRPFQKPFLAPEGGHWCGRGVARPRLERVARPLGVLLGEPGDVREEATDHAPLVLRQQRSRPVELARERPESTTGALDE